MGKEPMRNLRNADSEDRQIKMLKSLIICSSKLNPSDGVIEREDKRNSTEQVESRDKDVEKGCLKFLIHSIHELCERHCIDSDDEREPQAEEWEHQGGQCYWCEDAHLLFSAATK